jgi:hypothetical protein
MLVHTHKLSHKQFDRKLDYKLTFYDSYLDVDIYPVHKDIKLFAEKFTHKFKGSLTQGFKEKSKGHKQLHTS